MPIYRRFTYFLLSILIFSSSVLSNVISTSSNFSSTISSNNQHYFHLLNTEYDPQFQQMIIRFSDLKSITISYIFDIEFYKDNKWISTNEYNTICSPTDDTYEIPQKGTMVLDTFPFNTKTPGKYRLKLFIKLNDKKETIYLPFQVIDPVAHEITYFKDLTYESNYSPSATVSSTSLKYNDAFYSSLPNWVITQLKRGYKLGSILIQPNDYFTIDFQNSNDIDYKYLYLSVNGQNTTIDSINYRFLLPNVPKYIETSSTLTPEFTQSTLSVLTYTENYVSDFLEIPFSLNTEEKHKLVEAIVKKQPFILKKKNFDIALESVDKWLVESSPSILISLHEEQQIKLNKELPSFMDEVKSLKLFNKAGFNTSDTYFYILSNFSNYHHVAYLIGNIKQPLPTDGYMKSFEQASLVTQNDDSKFSAETFYTAKFVIPKDDFIKDSDTLLLKIKKKILALQSISATTINEKSLDQIISDLSNWKSESKLHEYAYWSSSIFPESLFESGTISLTITESFIPYGLSNKEAACYIATSDAYNDHLFICIGWYGN